MARSRKAAEQELQRLQMMLRAMKDQKDDAAQKVCNRIAAIELEITNANSPSGSGKSGSANSGSNVMVVAVLIILIGILAFAAMYFGILISKT